CTYCYARYAHRYVVERAHDAGRLSGDEFRDFERRIFVKQDLLAAPERAQQILLDEDVPLEIELGSAHVCTPVTLESRLPRSASHTSPLSRHRLPLPSRPSSDLARTVTRATRIATWSSGRTTRAGSPATSSAISSGTSSSSKICWARSSAPSRSCLTKMCRSKS